MLLRVGKFVVAGMLLCAIVGCSGTSSSNSQSTLVVSPSTMNFGNVAVGSSASLTATLSATNSSVVVSSAAWNGSGYSVSGITFPITVVAGTTVPYTVTFTPPSTGSSSGSISFSSNASDATLAESLTGEGIAAVTLTWDPSTSTVIGYNLYRGTHSGGPYSKLNDSLLLATTYTDSAVQSGATYFYVSTAMNAAHLESAYSNQATAVVP